MELIFTGVIVLVVLVLLAIFIRKAKRQPGSVHGDFRFDRHKGLESSTRGLFNRTMFP